jgi:hypothetical protein
MEYPCNERTNTIEIIDDWNHRAQGSVDSIGGGDPGVLRKIDRRFGGGQKPFD